MYEIIGKYTHKRRLKIHVCPNLFRSHLVKMVNKYKQYAKSRDFITFSMLRGRRKDDLVNCLRLYVIHTKQNLTKDIEEFFLSFFFNSGDTSPSPKKLLITMLTNYFMKVKLLREVRILLICFLKFSHPSFGFSFQATVAMRPLNITQNSQIHP